MKYFIYFLTICSILSSNSLSHSTSPYLKQHATNPINWYPWGEKAFEKAKEENKVIFVSIGYSTCHWCHVMAKESFENEEMAKLFNAYFICIKVDREEMPHLDSYYQEMYKKVKGRIGGWPLSIFLSADKKPFYLAAYIPPTIKSYHEGLDTLLPKLYTMHTYNYSEVKIQSEKITQLMNTKTKHLESKNANISTTTLSESFEENYDSIYSGFGRRKKFPESSKLELMMDIALLDNSKEFEVISIEMLDVMALRGLYDHIGGGFFRYTVDVAWEIPHYEKMLYNQAELIPLYVRAYQQTKKELYKNIVVETIAMLDKRFLYDNSYFSASDADTNHVEGDFFLFSTQEIEKALKKNTYEKELRESLDFSVNGNFNSKVHLNFHTNDRPKGFNAFKKELLSIRKTKEFPFIDKKINTAWNSMMIKALYNASSIDKSYAKKADAHLKRLEDLMFRKGELYHQNMPKNTPTQLALLEDYSFLISALLSAYEVDYKKERLDFAVYLLEKAKQKFYKNGTWYLSDDDLHIKADMKDKYYTSPLGKMLQNIIKLASYKASFKYDSLAQESLKNLNEEIQKNQSDTPASARAFLMQNIGMVTIKSSQRNLQKNAQIIQGINYPFIITKVQDNDAFLACTMKSCFAIDNDILTIKKIIERGEWR